MTVLAQFNASTLKVSYVAANNTAQTLVAGLCNNCGETCSQGFIDGETLACSESGGVPRFLCAAITGVKRCSDDGAIDTLYVCLEWDSTNGFGCHCWMVETTFDGNPVTVGYRTGLNCTGDSDAWIEDGTDAWFYNTVVDKCNQATNGFVQASCGNTYGIEVDGCFGGAVNRDCVAYDGTFTVCDPNTGNEWTV